MADPRDGYEIKYRVRFVDALGHGKDGDVLKTDQGNAVKRFHDRDVYTRECRAYRVLRDLNLDEIAGHQIPRSIRYDDQLLAIEMTIVKPPFVLDFASAYTDHEFERFGFTSEVLEEREEHWSEVFGEKWPDVAAIRHAFHQHTGLVLLDLSLNNIRFE